MFSSTSNSKEKLTKIESNLTFVDEKRYCSIATIIFLFKWDAESAHVQLNG